MPRPRSVLAALVTVVAVAGLLGALWAMSRGPDLVRRLLDQRLAGRPGLQLTIGKVNLHPLPGPTVVLHDLTLRSGQQEVLTVHRVSARLALLPLLGGKTRIVSLDLRQPVISLGSGLAASDRGSPQGEGTRVWSDVVTIHGGRIRTGGTAPVVEFHGIEGRLVHLRQTPAGQIAVAGHLDAKGFRLGRVTGQALQLRLRTADGMLQIDPLRFRAFDSAFTGQLTIARGGGPQSWRLSLAAERLDLGALFRSLSGHPLVAGRVKVQAQLTWENPVQILASLSGTFRATGSDLVQHGVPVDSLIQQMRNARKVNLLDIAGYVVAGPIGALAGQGASLARMTWTAHQDGRQPIERLVCDWSIDRGVARAEDVALRTPHNRLALQGRIDLSARRYQDVRLAVLNAAGCAELTESLSGPLADPQIKKTGILRTLAGPLLGVLQEGLDLLEPGGCDPFYQGAVQPPDN